MTTKDLKLARQRLNAQYTECGLPGRERHGEEIQNFIFERLKIRHTANAKKAKVAAGQVANIVGRHMNKTMFVCGVPGTGKTAVVLNVIEKLKKIRDSKNSPIHPFEAVYVNSQHLSKPAKIYSEILYMLTEENVQSEEAQDKLDKIFFPHMNDENEIKNPKGSRKGKSVSKDLKGKFIIVIIDELDLLYSEKRQTVFYSLFDWPTQAESKMILIGIANAMNLQERMIRSGKSRMGWETLIFESYTSACLVKILEVRLGASLLDKCFQPAAISVATKRIGRTTGDARRILDTCRLAIDKAIKLTDETGKFVKVTPGIVDEVGYRNHDLQKRNYIINCRPLCLFTLKCILIESNNSGEENVAAENVYDLLVKHIKKHEKFRKFLLNYSEYEAVLNELASVEIIYLDKMGNIKQKKPFLHDDDECIRDLILTEQMKI